MSEKEENPPAEAAAPAAEEEAEDEEDLEKLQAEIARMEAEAAKIAKETEDLENQKSGGGTGEAKKEELDPAKAKEEAAKRDGFSVYVGQVDYAATPEELLAHFEACGQVERITIVCDKKTGHPKGFAYIEFQADEAVENAIKLDGSTFKERQLKVTHKRVNDPNHYFNAQGDGSGGGGGRFGGGGGGRFGGGRGGGFRGRGGGFRGRGGGRRGGYRGGFRGGGRGGGGYHPYY